MNNFFPIAISLTHPWYLWLQIIINLAWCFWKRKYLSNHEIIDSLVSASRILPYNNNSI